MNSVNAPLRIVLVTTSMMRGGAEIQVCLLARELWRRGHTVHVVTMRDPEGYGEELTDLGIPLTSLSMHRGVPNPGAVVRLVRLLRALKPDVVHAHMVHANLLARVSRLFARVPVVISTAHSINEGGGWRDHAYRLTDGLSDLTTNVCTAGVRRYVESGAVPINKIRRVVNGLEVAPFECDAQARQRVRSELGVEDHFTWLAAGALEDVKDYPLMLDAFVQVAASNPQARLLIASDGSMRADLESLHASLDLTDNVHFLGLRSDVADLMSAADAFVMTSKWEGLPMVLLEASVARLPIVSTCVGGTDEVVTPASGILVGTREAGDVAKAMLHVMSLSEAERAVMGDAGYEHVVANFRLEDVVSTWIETYREFLHAGA